MSNICNVYLKFLSRLPIASTKNKFEGNVPMRRKPDIKKKRQYSRVNITEIYIELMVIKHI